MTQVRRTTWLSAARPAYRWRSPLLHRRGRRVPAPARSGPATENTDGRRELAVRARSEVVVERRYCTDQDSQTRALELLVNLPGQDKAARCTQHRDGGDTKEGSRDDFRTNAILRQQ